MNDLAIQCKSLKEGFTPKIKDSKRPVHYWSEKDVFNDEIVDAFVIIFRTRGCSWALKSGCSMCGYFNDSLWDKISEQDLMVQFESAMKYYKDEKIVKIFNSGSFFDDNEIPPNFREKIIKCLVKKTDKISVESRPEYIMDKSLAKIHDIISSKVFEVGVGLESANDFVLKYSINKGFEFKDYENAAKNLKKFNFSLKTYVLVKPPFLTEKESISDSISTIKKIDKFTDIISLNPVNVQRNTFIDYLWKRKQYRPPWLWSILEILTQGKKNTDKTIKCDIAGGGSIRGAHNCKSCDNKILNLIQRFSLKQDPNIFKDISCDCKTKWYDQLDIEDLCFGSYVDFSRSVL